MYFNTRHAGTRTVTTSSLKTKSGLIREDLDNQPRNTYRFVDRRLSPSKTKPDTSDRGKSMASTYYAPGGWERHSSRRPPSGRISARWQSGAYRGKVLRGEWCCHARRRSPSTLSTSSSPEFIFKCLSNISKVRFSSCPFFLISEPDRNSEKFANIYYLNSRIYQTISSNENICKLFLYPFFQIRV